MTKPTKLKVEHEARFVSEWVLLNYPHDTVKYRCPLGSAPKDWLKRLGAEKALRSYRPFRHEVDAMIICKEKIVLIEGKILRVLDGAAKLIIYRDLVSVTPEVEYLKNLPVEAIVLTPQPPTWAEMVTKKYDIKFVVWKPDWLVEYWEWMNKYWTADERAERERRKNVLKKVGYR